MTASASRPPAVIPQHIAIIMDGNGRWARQRGLSRSEGHRAGADAVMRSIENCQKYGVKYLTLYAFSSENWKRSRSEIAALMRLLGEFLDKQTPMLDKYQIRLNIIGELSRLPAPLRKRLQAVMAKSAHYQAGVLTVALSYGSRNEITAAVKAIAQQCRDGKLSVDDINETSISEHLQTADLPDPDLIIRSAGEQRLSNFLLWQASYAELYFTPVFWPDFGDDDFAAAMVEYSRRERRYGGVIS
jgi:undecaprenyl diphosphate synthase